MSLIEINEHSASVDALDVIEGVATANGWSYERANEDEITLVVAGRWTDYQVSFTWLPNLEAVHLACAFDFKASGSRNGEIAELIARINEHLWVGHFDLWVEDGLVMYRNAHVLAGGNAVAPSQCEALLGAAVDACERYYQAFQFVLWAGKSAQDAIAAATFETTGEA